MNNLEYKYIWQLQVGAYETDFSGKLKPGGLLMYLQEAASRHAMQLGAGYGQMKEMGIYWVLSRMKVEIIKMPAMHEKATLVTWPKCFSGLFALRDFIMLDSDGEILAKATSAWLIIDMLTLRPRRPESTPLGFKRLENEHAIEEIPEKITPGSAVDNSLYIKVNYSDLDINDHVNNTRYIEWACDLLGKEFFEKYNITSIETNYLDQVKYNEELHIKNALKNAGECTISIENTSRNKQAFSAKINFTPIVSI